MARKPKTQKPPEDFLAALAYTASLEVQLAELSPVSSPKVLTEALRENERLTEALKRAKSTIESLESDLSDARSEYHGPLAEEHAELEDQLDYLKAELRHLIERGHGVYRFSELTPATIKEALEELIAV